MTNPYYSKIVIAIVTAVVITAFVIRINAEESSSTPQERTNQSLPTFIDLGSDSCESCKAMTPVIAELKRDFQTSMNVKFIDVWKNPDAGGHYEIKTIPTQILLDPYGKEITRHVGYWSVEDITKRLTELGYPQKRSVP